MARRLTWRWWNNTSPSTSSDRRWGVRQPAYLRKMLGSGGTENLGLNPFRHCRGAGFQMVAWDRNLGDSWGDRLFLGTGVRQSVRWRGFVSDDRAQNRRQRWMKLLTVLQRY